MSKIEEAIELLEKCLATQLDRKDTGNMSTYMDMVSKRHILAARALALLKQQPKPAGCHNCIIENCGLPEHAVGGPCDCYKTTQQPCKISDVAIPCPDECGGILEVKEFIDRPTCNECGKHWGLFPCRTNKFINKQPCGTCGGKGWKKQRIKGYENKACVHGSMDCECHYETISCPDCTGIEPDCQQPEAGEFTNNFSKFLNYPDTAQNPRDYVQWEEMSKKACNRLDSQAARIKGLKEAIQAIWPFVKDDFPKGTGKDYGTCATEKYVEAARMIEREAK